jgi:hypothetical protein
MIAANLENLLFLLLVALAALFQLLAKTAGKTSRGQTKRTSTPIPGTPPQIPRAPRESDEAQIRKFLEALGQLPTSKPPPSVVPRTDVPPRPLAPVQPPAVYPASPWKLIKEERRKRDIIPKEIPLSRTVSGGEEIAPPKITSAPGFEVHEGPVPIEPQAIIKTPLAPYASIAKDDESKEHIAILLASKSGLREAIVLREILGPPRSLRALEFIGT